MLFNAKDFTVSRFTVQHSVNEYNYTQVPNVYDVLNHTWAKPKMVKYLSILTILITNLWSGN